MQSSLIVVFTSLQWRNRAVRDAYRSMTRTDVIPTERGVWRRSTRRPVDAVIPHRTPLCYANFPEEPWRKSLELLTGNSRVRIWQLLGRLLYEYWFVWVWWVVFAILTQILKFLRWQGNNPIISTMLIPMASIFLGSKYWKRSRIVAENWDFWLEAKKCYQFLWTAHPLIALANGINTDKMAQFQCWCCLHS